MQYLVLNGRLNHAKNILTTGYVYNRFFTALNESLLIMMYLDIFRGTSTRYGKLIAHRSDVRRYPSSYIRSNDIQVRNIDGTRAIRFERSRDSNGDIKYSDEGNDLQKRYNYQSRSTSHDRHERSSQYIGER